MSRSRAAPGPLSAWAVAARGKGASEGESSPRDLWIASPPEAPLASVGLRVAGDGALLRVWLNPRRPRSITAIHRLRPEERQAVDELCSYLAGTLRRFAVPWRLPEEATAFRKAVLRAAARIPYGETVGYGELADLAGHPGAARAVGSAMASNPLPLVIPCHRVVAAQGRLGGFTGGLATKQALLAHEGRRVPAAPGPYR